jgi:predicted metal-dependent HD superfamily phosphohydrolase
MDKYEMYCNEWMSLVDSLDTPLKGRELKEASYSIYMRLLDGYQAEPNRFYHTFAHIKYCLDLVDKHKDSIDDVNAMKLAFWFHDVIYKTGDKSSELHSAILAVRLLRQLGLHDDLIKRVRELILATQYSSTLTNCFANSKDRKYHNDILFMRDIDFAAFADDYDAVLANGVNIYLEAGRDNVRMDKFLEGRIGFLKFISSSKFKLFHTDVFHNEKEAVAKRNVCRELEELEEQGLPLYQNLHLEIHMGMAY